MIMHQGFSNRRYFNDVPEKKIKAVIAEIEQINEYDYPEDERTISNFKGIVLDIIRKHTGVSE